MATHTYPATLHGFLFHLSSYGVKPALAVHGDPKALSYDELIASITIAASALKKHNDLNPGDRVMLYGLTGPDWVITFFACLLVGYVVVPIDIRMSTELVDDLLAQTQPQLIVCKEVLGLKTSTRSVLFAQLLSLAPKPRGLRDFAPLPDSTIAEIILTSGTWSQPKGVTLSHGNLLSNLAGVDAAYNLGPDASLLSLLPLSHAYEQMCGLLVPLYRGAAITYIPEIRADILTEAIKKHHSTAIVAVPRILELLRKGVLRKIAPSKRGAFERFVAHSRRLPMKARRRLFAKVHQSIGTSLATLFIGGAPLEPRLDQFFQGLGYTVLVGYGLSETAPVLCISRNQRRGAGNVGQPLSNVAVTLSSEGEVLARGSSVFYGYWPQQHKDPHFSTGDLGRFDRHGNLILMGRSKNLVIFPSGDKIFLEDVEKIADGLAGVEESCAIDLGTASKPRIHIFAVTSITELTPLLASINAKLPFSVRVTSISRASIPTLPRTHTLKLSRKQILELHAEVISKLTARPS